MTRYLLAIQQPDDPEAPGSRQPDDAAGPAAALAVVETLDLPRYRLRDAVRADLLTRLDRPDEARAALDAALSGTDNPGERALPARRRRAL